MEKIHDRMPVILSPKEESEWLDPSRVKPEQLSFFLKPCNEKLLAAHEISSAINSPKNNEAKWLRPIV
jgi:putative SOS response-associated peptidase YedK